jgi:hypothetical protein
VHIPMITVSALVKQSDTVPPRVCSSAAMTLLKRKRIREKMELEWKEGVKERKKEIRKGGYIEILVTG